MPTKKNTYSELSSSVMGETIKDAERFLLLQTDWLKRIVVQNMRFTYIEEVRDEIGVFGGTVERLSKHIKSIIKQHQQQTVTFFEEGW
jgi:hypothetical protein